jgi:hypothetical protein
MMEQKGIPEQAQQAVKLFVSLSNFIYLSHFSIRSSSKNQGPVTIPLLLGILADLTSHIRDRME